MKTIVLAEVTRGTRVESCHRGAVVVTDARGRIIARGGSPDYITYLRSAAKPLQALPVVEMGAADYFGLTEKELAVITASHRGEEIHVEAVRSILGKLGQGEEALQCGTHSLRHRPTAEALIRAGIEPGPVYCNCSGKHAGMLALTLNQRWPVASYPQLDHPLQKTMLRVVAEMAEFEPERITVAKDGCGVAVFALPLRHMARAYARLVFPWGLPTVRQLACRRVTQAMQAHPEMIAGPGSLCTELMAQTRGKLVAKAGAEGIYCVGLVEKGWGLAVKIEDGSSRPLAPVVVEVLRQLGVLSSQELAALSRFARTEIRNNLKEKVGEIRPAFQLELL